MISAEQTLTYGPQSATVSAFLAALSGLSDREVARIALQTLDREQDPSFTCALGASVAASLQRPGAWRAVQSALSATLAGAPSAARSAPAQTAALTALRAIVCADLLPREHVAAALKPFAGVAPLERLASS